MTDTYNDTTGSRKKFLIPLVVLLLCAVSLTGAGYAYNSTVTGNGDADIKDSFVIDLYSDAAGSTAITEKISVANSPLIFTTVKSIGDSNTITGTLAYDATSPIIYTGYFKVSANGIANTKATVTDRTVTAVVASNDAHITVANTALVPTLTIYQGNTATGEVAGADFQFTIGTVYCYTIAISTTYTSSVTSDPVNLDAKAFADAVVAALDIDFSVSLTANPVAVA